MANRYNYIMYKKTLQYFDIKTALDPLAIKTVTAVKALQLLDDLYKLSQLRLAVTAVKAVQLLEDLYKLS